MSLSSTPTAARKTRSTNLPSIVLDQATASDELLRHLHSPLEFANLCHHYDQSLAHRSALIPSLCQILTIENVENEIRLFILDRLIVNHENISEVQFRQELLPFVKQVFSVNTENNPLLLPTIRLLLTLVANRSNILNSTLAEWLSCFLNFLVTTLSSSTYTIYGDLVLDLLSSIVKQFTSLSKEIVDILGRSSSSSIITTHFLNQLKTWIKNPDDIRLALFSIRLWQLLAAVLSRLLIRGHTKGNEMLAVMEDAFIVPNYSIRSAAFTTWSNFMLHIHQLDDLEVQQLTNRLLKLFLTPFLSDSTSKSKSASIAKCQAWITLISIYPQNLHDVILPFLSFAFGNHLSSNTISTTTAWWPECRQIGGQFLYDFLVKNIHGEFIIKSAADQILNYLFDSIVDQLLEYPLDSNENLEDSLWLKSWNVYLNHLINIFKSNNSINEEQRVAINTCLLTRIEQLWIDSRIETRFLLKLFETFEQIGFPLAIETVLRDSSTRTKTLSAAQIHPSSGIHKSQDKPLHYRTTLSDQCLHMMLEHAIRFNEDDQTIEESYLHVLTYLIDTLSKTSDENFCSQTSSLLLKCSVEFSHQPLTIPSLFWHIWFRCSTHLINILNRSHAFELNNRVDNQKQETSIELLLRPFAFNDTQRLDYSYTLLWIQLFKALCRLTVINHDHLIDLIVELLRNEPAFEQAINDQHNQRLFGLILIIIKTLLKTFSDIDVSGIGGDRSTNNFVHLFSATQKRSSSSSIALCLTQFSVIVNHILQRLLSNNENNTQYSLVCHCLSKSTKISSMEQTKSFVFTYIRDLLVDLLSLCKNYYHLEIILKNLNQLLPFLYHYEQSINANLSLMASPISKQQIDNVILNKILTIITTVFEPSNSSSLLQLIYPILILAFRHQKTIVRNKARKCWNETFGRMTFIVYPNELRMCLRDLKDKEHLLLPCFLADHDNSNTAGSGPLPGSTDESQLSQQVDIPTQLISSVIHQQKSASPARFIAPTNRSINTETNEPIFVPIIQQQRDSPVAIGKRLSSINSCLTENQKEKLRARHSIPLICDDSSNTQSNSCTVDSSINDQQLRNKRLTTGISLFKQSVANPPEENEVSPAKTNNEEEISEEPSSIAKKLRRSCRPSMSGRKSLATNSRKKLPMQSADETISILPSISSPSPDDVIQKPLIKGILKRLSPTKPRQDHSRRVAFHDQVKVLVFASPSRRDLLAQQRKKSPSRDEMKSPTRIIPKENLPLRKQPMSARRLSVMNTNEPSIPPSPASYPKGRASKLFHPNDALVDWTVNEPSVASNENQVLSEMKTIDPIFPSLVDCEKPIESFVNLLYDGLCPPDTLAYFHSNKITTIGDIARSTASQIENHPIPSPKLTKLQKALERFANSSTNETDGISLIPIATTSDETIANGNTISPEIEAMITNSQDKLYDVDTLIDSLDYEKLYLHDEVPLSTSQTDFKRPRRQLAVINQAEIHSPQKRGLSPTSDDRRYEQKQQISTLTLGDRLQKAAEMHKAKGRLPFDDDYIELVRQLLQNSCLTHLEQLHLKTLFLKD